MKELEGFKAELEKTALLPLLLAAGGSAALGYGAYKGYSAYKAQREREKQLAKTRSKQNMFGRLTPRINPQLM